MADPRVIVVGAGPAGVRAAQALVAAGLRPVVIEEGLASGGQIYRRQPALFRRSYETLYGFEAGRARALHQAFDDLAGAVDFRPDTLAWNVYRGALHTVTQGVARELPFDALILATGATDRLLPIRGWTLPGCYSLGASQIALKAQACAIGRRVVFLGTGPLLYLVSYQYAKAGVEVAAVLDTSATVRQLRALPRLAVRPNLLLKGLYYRAQLTARGISVHGGVTPLEIAGASGVEGVRFRDSGGAEQTIACDAVGMGFHLRSETQLADLARCEFVFDEALAQWRPQADPDGRTTARGVYVAGDGARILGADAAEISGELAALAALKDLGRPAPEGRMTALRARQRRMEAFRKGLAAAFPWPAQLARTVADDVLLCRCEAITAGELRRSADEKDAPELNRAKAFVRVGMGRCQGRFCGAAAAEILADQRREPLAAVGRLRGAAPVKPLPMATVRDEA
ncbi:NAD(P)/FAD-dependent oxidoreductase [Phenylobacterium sp. LjRoot225]|uniref:FAD/NAD(P)-dependent oxidoreductase n=1 Tax=Phenylobacterium sp. LjRoot225 TaxID=3342285 RepID=UPI003ECDECCA